MSRKLRIGIACYPTYGGSGVVATELGIALAAEGHEIHFLAYEHPIRLSGFHRNVYYHQVSVPEYPLFKYPPYDLALATKIAEVVDLHHLDLLHVHYAIPHCVSAVMAKQMVHARDLKIVVTLHGTDITIVGNDPSYKRATLWGLEQADGITAVSEYLRKQTCETFDLGNGIEVIPNFVDLERFDVKPCPEAAALRQDREKVLVHVSNFRPVKRVMDLVEAFGRIHQQVQARLLMVGDGPDHAAAVGRAAELGVADKVHFLGSQEAVEKILPCADVFVLPSEYESFGLAALEAMACGVAVVATDAGGIPEVVVPGHTGELYPMGDVEALARTLLKVLGDEPKLRELKAGARRRAEEEFALGSIRPMYVDYYHRVLDGKARGCQAAPSR